MFSAGLLGGWSARGGQQPEQQPGLVAAHLGGAQGPAVPDNRERSHEPYLEFHAVLLRRAADQVK